MTAAAFSPDNDRLGTITGPREITFVRLLPGPIERVWSFLTDGDKRRLWLADGEMEPRVGGAVRLRFHNAELTPKGETIPEHMQKHAGVGETLGRVTRWDPPHGLAFSWSGEPGEASEVRVTLEPASEGKVRLTLVHSGLRNRAGMLSVSGGWHAHLGLLVAALEGRAADRFWGVMEDGEAAYDSAIPPD